MADGVINQRAGGDGGRREEEEEEEESHQSVTHFCILIPLLVLPLLEVHRKSCAD